MMQVTNRFQCIQYLKKLPEDFATVKVDVESLKDNSLRKLCRDLEKTLHVEQAALNYSRDDYTEYLKKLLDDEQMAEAITIEKRRETSRDKKQLCGS